MAKAELLEKSLVKEVRLAIGRHAPVEFLEPTKQALTLLSKAAHKMDLWLHIGNVGLEHVHYQVRVAYALRAHGYLLGMMVGDGSLIRHKRRGEFLAKIALDGFRDQDIFQFVSSMFERAGKRVNVRIEGRMLILRIWSKTFYNFVGKHVRHKKRPSSRHHTKSLLGFEEWNKGFAVGFIGGLIDRDGHIERRKRGGHYGAIITTSSPSLRDQVRDLCKLHQINASWRLNHRGCRGEKPRYAVHITSDDLNTLCSKILCVKHLRYHGGPGRI